MICECYSNLAWEVIIVDDNSPDGTQEVAKQLATVYGEDKIVSFDVAQIFTKILLEEAIQVVKEVTDPGTSKFVEVCLCSTFFTFQGEYFEQTIGVAMGLPLPPIVANLYMEKFEKTTLEVTI